jgi:hypothetical protein
METDNSRKSLFCTLRGFLLSWDLKDSCPLDVNEAFYVSFALALYVM